MQTVSPVAGKACHSLVARVVERARIVLRAADGLQDKRGCAEA
jgi:hypothetical protein